MKERDSEDKDKTAGFPPPTLFLRKSFSVNLVS